MMDEQPTYLRIVDREEWLEAEWDKSVARMERGGALVTYYLVTPVPEDVIASIKRAFDSEAP